MFDLHHMLWDTEEEEEEEELAEEEGERGSSLEDTSADSEESCCEDCQECGRGWQDPAIHHPLHRPPCQLRHCRWRLFAPYDLQDKGHSPQCTGHRRDSGEEIHPWGRGSPPWDPPLGSWVRDIGAIGQSNWHLEQVAASSSRTLAHPSFQNYFAAVAARSSPACQPFPGGPRPPQPSGGPLPLVDCSHFFYSDPTMPPGHRIYSCLSASSQEVLRSLRLNTPAPIMCTWPAAASGHHQLSDQEVGAVSALLALPAGARSDASPCLAPGAAECGEMGTPAPCQ